MAATQVLASYTLDLLGPGSREVALEENISVREVGLSQSFLREVQENINDLLPDGYHVRIRGQGKE